MSTTTPNPTHPKPLLLKPTTKTIATVPSNSIILHSTNCFGNWGAGFALALHSAYPFADKLYAAHCDAHRPTHTRSSWPARDTLVGTCLLIPPQRLASGAFEGNGVWIACLFTSYGYGRATKKKAGRDGKAAIARQTERALGGLREVLEGMQRGEWIVEEGLGADGEGVRRLRRREEGEEGAEAETAEKERPEMVVYSPKFNSGSFGVKWEETEEMVGRVFEGWEGKWFVLAPPKE